MATSGGVVFLQLLSSWEQLGVPHCAKSPSTLLGSTLVGSASAKGLTCKISINGSQQRPVPGPLLFPFQSKGERGFAKRHLLSHRAGVGRIFITTANLILLKMQLSPSDLVDTDQMQVVDLGVEDNMGVRV